MESSVSMDPLEKIMQELYATNAESNSSSPQPKELPHRPIILPPEIKEEPVDGETESTCATTEKNEPNQITANNATIDDTSQGKSSATAATLTESSEIDGIAAAAAPPIQGEINGAVGAPPKETQQAEVVTPTTTPTTPHVPLAPAIQIKEERVENDVEVPEGIASNLQNKSKHNEDVANCAIHTEEGEILERVKSEPVDIIVATWAATTPPSSNQASTNNMTATQQPTRNNLTAVFGGNYNAEVGDHEMDETLPDNFFDDLLQDADDITAAALQATPATVEPQEVQPKAVKPRIKTEPLDSTNTPEVTQSALIPDNFFDDLLVDHVAERIEDVVNHGLEEKYSERLRELQELEYVEQRSHKAHKKHKKKKKKSHKRSHDSLEDEESMVSNQKRSKHTSPSISGRPISGVATQSLSRSHATRPTRIRVKSEVIEIPNSPQRSGSLFPHAAAQPFLTSQEPLNIFNLDVEEPETSVAAAKRVKHPNPNRIRVKTEFATFPPPIAPPAVVDEEPDICLPLQEKELFQRRCGSNRNGLIIDMTAPLGFKRIKLEKDAKKPNNKPANFVLPKDKMPHAKQRAIAAIEEFKKGSSQESEHLPAFLYTTTVRKLPNSSSYYKQQIYENRSPLHNVNNVLYKFNSHANHFNLHEWGLEQMPRVAAKVAKILGFDAHALAEKQRTVKLPLKLQKIKKEALEQQADEEMVQPQESFLVTVATQTNDVTVLEVAAARLKIGHDIAVQTMEERSSTGTQTTVGADTTSSNSYDDLPLMQHIKSLNENQLMALSDFAELILEPAPETGASAMDLYRLRQRMMDIYKCAQLPSELKQASKLPPRQLISQSTRPNVQHTRDPRIDRMATVNESPPPPPPRQAHTTKLPPPHLSAAPLQHRPPQKMPPHLREQTSSLPAQKIPVISNVQSYHPSMAVQPPQDTLLGSSKYYGRGGLRR